MPKKTYGKSLKKGSGVLLGKTEGGAPVAIPAYLKEEVGLICNLIMFFCLRPFFRFLAFLLSVLLTFNTERFLRRSELGVDKISPVDTKNFY